MLLMGADLNRIPPILRAKPGGPRRACAREGCPYVFVGSEGSRYCSLECGELVRRDREAERKRRRRREAGAAVRAGG
jgi:hypothetical protein